MPQDYTDIHYDSRQVSPGSIFVAIKGEHSDGHDFIEDAIGKGAIKIVVEDLPAKEYPGIEIVQVEDSRLVLASLSSEFYQDPSEQINIIGVTGTNGKTTVTHLIQSLLDGCPLLGTMGLKQTLDSKYKDMGNTTPQSKEIQKLISEQVSQGYKYLTMEVSSHAVDQKRTAGIKFKGMIVTNLTQDHLDYHITMDNYFKAKAACLAQVSDYAILNADDSYYEDFKREAGNLRVISFGINSKSDFNASNIEYSDHGLSYDLLVNDKKLGRISLQLNGQFNVYNSLAAIAAVMQEGLSFEDIKSTLQQVAPVAGRFEVIKNDNSPYCIVDYAHSPDGLMNVLQGARELLKDGAALICLFGCGGDRDITKRPKMAKIAYDLADRIYVTSDNPRSEDPDQIIADILTGIPDMAKVQVLADRRQAIQQAIQDASQEDIVVIAGKGHEDYQILKDRTIHFDDREEVRQAIGLGSHSGAL